MLSSRTESIQIALTVVLSFILFYSIVTSVYATLLKAGVAIVVLLLTGIMLRRLSKADGWNGFIMVNLKEGVYVIDWFRSIVQEKWNVLTDIGLVMGFGISTIFAFKYISKKFYIISLAIFVGYVLILTPYIPSIMLGLIDLPRASGEAAQQSANLLIPTAIALFVFGFVGMVIFSLLANAVAILGSIAGFLMGNAGALASATPGATLIIPGLNLPLVEGIIALLILLIVHEGGHGVSARLSKIKIKATGFLTFGWIPVGAYVDIDEKQLEKRKIEDKVRVAVAGSTANLLTSLIFLIPVIILLSIIPTYYADALTVSGFTRDIVTIGGELTTGSLIYSINGVQLDGLANFQEVKDTLKPNSQALLDTDTGEMMIETNENSKMGIQLTQSLQPEYAWLRFLYNVLGLTTVLNFLIGVVNLLPVPAFDGYRLFELGLKNKKWLNVLAYTIIIAFAVNLLPWLWR